MKLMLAFCRTFCYFLKSFNIFYILNNNINNSIIYTCGVTLLKNA
ncbi:hypothetical protein [Bacillus phage vB_BceS-M2]